MRHVLMLLLAIGAGGCNACPEGEDCDDDQTPCDVLDCNNGTCSEVDGTAECLCDLGWEGLLCDQMKDACEPAPCVHGTCTDGGDGIAYTCACEEGWEGDDCESSVDDCPFFDPCVNGACVDGHMAWQCDCDLDWAGSFCDTVEDSCATFPCGHASLCTDGTGTFTCDDSVVALVDPEIATSGDGTSWEAAYKTIEEAVAYGADVIWVKSTTLTATDANPVLVIPEGITLVGGFGRDLTGRGGNPDTRLPEQRTVLDGDDLALHVVIASANSGLDGFEITGGMAAGATDDESRGGGILIDDVDGVTLRNVLITGNSADLFGGGLACVDASGLLLDGVEIDANTVEAPTGVARGGGAWFSACAGTIEHSDVTSNIARGTGRNIAALGGGLYVVGGDVVLDDVRIEGNQAIGGDSPGTNISPVDGGDARGGGVWIDASPTVEWTGVELVGNNVSGGDGGNVTCTGAPPCEQNGGCSFTNGSGGDAQGAGLYTTNATVLALEGGRVVNNAASRGAAASGGSCYLNAPTPPFCPQSSACPAGAVGTEGGGGIWGPGVDFPNYADPDKSGNSPNLVRPCPAGYTGYECEVPP